MRYFAFLLILFFNSHLLLSAQTGVNSDDKTLSPYFNVIDNDTLQANLPLYSTEATVDIAGVIADVKVRQVYHNTGSKPLEAVYVFPASTRAAVYEMTMYISDRVLKAEIQKKEEARKTYDKAKKEGKSASLLEQSRPNVFQMNVANIMPGDTIVVEMKYTELLIPEAGIYEFVYPTVVGPRYSKNKETVVEKTKIFSQKPSNIIGKPAYKWDIKINLNAGMPLSEVICATHKVNISEVSPNVASVELDNSQEYTGNKDFILQYKLCGDRIQTGLLLTENQKENFFLLMLQPPKRVEQSDIPKREFIFIIDVSGSMRAFPLDITKGLIKKIFDNLKPDDYFNIQLFERGLQFFSNKSLPATSENINKALKMLNSIDGNGGTELLPAIKSVFEYPKKEGYSRIISIFTDGFVEFEEEAFDMIRNNLDKSNFFAFGIGSSVNRYLIEGIARAGNAVPFIAVNKSQAEEIAAKFAEYIKSPVMTDIKVEYEGFNVYDVEPKTIPDVLSDRPILLYGKYSGTRGGKLTVSGLNGQQRLKVELPIMKFASVDTGQALKYLWARNKIAVLSDYCKLRYQPKDYATKIDEITDLGLKYNLLTNFTSFVAVDYLIRSDGKMEKVVQQLPLPAGVERQSLLSIATPNQSVINATIEELLYYGVSNNTNAVKDNTNSERPSIDLIERAVKSSVNSDNSDNGIYLGGGVYANALEPGRKVTFIYIGPYLGWNFNNYNIDISSQNYSKWKINSKPTGNNFCFGLFYEQFVGHRRNTKHSIVARLIYNPFKSSITENINVDSSFIENANSKTVAGEQTIDINYSTLSLDLLYKYNIFKGLVLTAGPSFDLALRKEIIQKIQLSGADFKFKKFAVEKMAENEIISYENDRKIVVKEGDIKDVKTFRFALKGGIQYELRTGTKFDLIPSFLYNFGLTDFTSTKSWKLNAFQIGLDIRYCLSFLSD